MNRNKWIKYAIHLLFFILPILDVLRTTPLKDFELFGFALIELVNILLIGLAFLLTLTKVDKKKWFIPFSYIALVIIYCVFHYKHMITFDNTIYTYAEFSFLVETYYIGRAYCLPIVVLYILFMNKDVFDKKFYENVFKYLVFVISASIIVLNLTRLSYRSYSLENETIYYNMFEYLYKDYAWAYKQLCSRGWFHSANEISAVLFATFPMTIYLFYRDFKWDNIVLFFMQFITMIIIGTRTAAVGCLITTVLIFVAYIFLNLINKKKIVLKTLVVAILITAINGAYFSVSPFIKSKQQDQVYAVLNNNVPEQKKVEDMTIEEFRANLKHFLIREEFVEAYPLENDFEWYIERSNLVPSINANSREFKIAMFNRIKERNNNPKDNLFGLGYTLNFLDVERDYVNQYFIFGSIGAALLLGPYFMVLAYCFYQFICQIKYRFRLETMISFMIPVFMMAVAYLSGHVYGMVSPSMVLSLGLGYLCLDNMRKEELAGE